MSLTGVPPPQPQGEVCSAAQDPPALSSEVPHSSQWLPPDLLFGGLETLPSGLACAALSFLAHSSFTSALA